MDNKDNVKEALTDIFSSIISSSENETRINYGEIIKKLRHSGYDLHNADTFNVMINFQIEQILGVVASELSPAPYNMENLNKIQFLFLNYDFFETNIEKLITKREGSCCCSDKTGHILEAYHDYLVRGFVSELNEARSFYIFNFGTYQDWLDFCDGLFRLYYGDNEKYLVTYKKLLESELRNHEK
jgi:hypothetical protein